LRDFDCTQDLSPVQLVQQGLCDAVKLFVKDEPHKYSKIEEGRLRLIFSVSAIDNVVARLLCSLQNETEINDWENIPHKPGMGLNDSGLSTLTRNVEEGSLLGPISEADVKGWDWSVQLWELNSDCDRRIDLCGARGTVYERILRAHYYCISRKVMVLSNGVMFQQLRPGLMPSGWYNTSGTNSFMRCLDHYMVVEMYNRITSSWPWPKRIIQAWVIAMGDDTVERFVPGAKGLYKELGKTVDMYKEVKSSNFEFCSTRFFDGVGCPVNIDKQLVKILSSNPRDTEDWYTRLNQFDYEMRHFLGNQSLRNLIVDSGWGVPGDV
jgi:hypothetical protein